MTVPSESAPSDQMLPQNLGQRLLSYVDDVAVFLLAGLAAITFLGLAGLSTGTLIDRWSQALYTWLGWSGVLIPACLAGAAFWLGLRAAGRGPAVRWSKVIAGEIAILALLGLLGVISGPDLPEAELGNWGGLLGWGIARLVVDLVGRLVAGILLAAVAIGAGLRAAQSSIRSRGAVKRVVQAIEQRQATQQSDAHRGPGSTSRRRAPRRVPEEYRKHFHLGEAQEGAGDAARRSERLPELDLLNTGGPTRVTEKEINQVAGLIEKTLADFGIPARVVDFQSGPTITQFAVEPGYTEQTGPDGEVKRHKVRVAQISGLANDLALALSAPRLRIEAPVPGQPYVGVEVPNQRGALVRLRPLLESEAFQSIDSPLAIGLGRDVTGTSVAADLAAMPHLLIAGTTGSGKSICINSIATCLVMNNSPEDLRLVMIDPKMVELLRFNGMPHLFGQVETQLDRIVAVLRWCTHEMDRRYRKLEEARARDIDSYNRKARRQRGLSPLPRVVVLMDELADLMMMAPDQTERTLVRLAQMARAVGMHLVVATQRPSTDIVTGLIKANFPARISFATASGTDSRVILDTQGAETLLGKGDMLYLAAEASAPVRLQGVFVSEDEVARVIDFWTAGGSTLDQDEQAPWESMLVRQEVLEEHDDIIERAIEVVRAEGEASASLLQRRLRVGYPRAARLMDELEELGVVGAPQSGGKTREVLIGENEDPLSSDDE